MGHGLPDWYRGVDVAYQALSQMIVRPKYGGEQESFIEAAVAANTTTWGIALSGKGMIYTIHYGVDAAATIDNDYISVLVDGNVLKLPTFGTFLKYNWSNPAAIAGTGTMYDAVNFKYAGQAGYGITFESSYVLGYTETYGRTPMVYMKIVYALIAP